MFHGYRVCLLQFAQQNAELQKQMEISALQQQLVNSYQPSQQQQQPQQQNQPLQSQQQQNPHLQQALGVGLASSTAAPVSMQNAIRNVNAVGGITSALQSGQNLVPKPEPAMDNTNIGKTIKLESDVESKQESDESSSTGKPAASLGGMKLDNSLKLELKGEIKNEPSDDVKQEADIKREIKTENGSGDGSGDAKQENLNASRDSIAASPAPSGTAKPRVKKSKHTTNLATPKELLNICFI